MTLRITFLVWWLCAMLVGCGPGCDGPPSPAPSQTELRAYTTASRELAWSMYGPISRRPANVVFSPATAQLSLAMLVQGARGETARELERAVNGGRGREGVRRASRHLLEQWECEPGEGRAALRWSARVLVQDGLTLRQPYRHVLVEDFGAEVVPVDSLSATTLVITSRVDFTAAWAHPFNEGATEPSRFELPGGQTVRVPMMYLSETLPYAETDTAQLVELPYRDERFGLVLIRPRAGRDALLERRITAGEVERWLGELTPVAVELRLPRFHARVDAEDLIPTLRAAGVERVFEPVAADLGRMTEGERELFVSAMRHSASFEVNESGTRASSTVEMTVASSAAASPMQLRFDRPFLFILRDRRARAPLFIGRIVDPRRAAQ